MIKNYFFKQEGEGTVITGTGGTPDPAPAPSGTATPAPKTQPVSIPENWKEALGEEFKSEPSLSHITDIKTLAKSYVNAQKLIGKDKIVLPGKHGTDEEWRGVFHKLGLPEKFEEYKIEVDKESGFDENFLAEFRQEAHGSNILPNQAEKLLKWYSGKVKGIASEQEKSEKIKTEEGINKLKQEWGEGFGKQVQTARLALKEFGSPELVKLMDSGLGNNPEVIKFMAKIGATLSEDKLIDAGVERVKMTPQEAETQINDIMANYSHPYYDTAHPNHKNAVDEVNRLYKYLYPESKK